MSRAHLSSAAVAALVLAAPVAAAEPASSAAHPPANWSLGAGVLYGGTSSIEVPLWSIPSGPSVYASLERRIGARTWLVAGVSGYVDRRRMEIPPGDSGTIRNDARNVALDVGVRVPVTGAGAPLTVSGVVLAEGLYLEGERTTVGPYDAGHNDFSAWGAGLSAGLAVDRELLPGLSVRVGTQLLRATYVRAIVRVPREPSTSASAVTAEAYLSPRLELRLAF